MFGIIFELHFLEQPILAWSVRGSGDDQSQAARRAANT